MTILLAAAILGQGPRLLFSDEFRGKGRPDERRWTYERGFVRNRELQWYQPENAWVENGYLMIEARRERVKNPSFDPGVPRGEKGPASRPQEEWRRSREYAEYTSASLTMKGLHAFRYGRWEIRARFRPEPGLWPAIWTVGKEGTWPSNGEIDIMEFYQQTLLANTAYGEGGGIWDTVKRPIAEFLKKDPDWGKKFHVWRMEWTADVIRLSVDDELLNETDIRATKNPDGRNPFQQPHQLILNLAIGSTGGDPSRTRFPARFEIDWVRIWDR